MTDEVYRLALTHAFAFSLGMALGALVIGHIGSKAVDKISSIGLNVIDRCNDSTARVDKLVYDTTDMIRDGLGVEEKRAKIESDTEIPQP